MEVNIAAKLHHAHSTGKKKQPGDVGHGYMSGFQAAWDRRRQGGWEDGVTYGKPLPPFTYNNANLTRHGGGHAFGLNQEKFTVWRPDSPRLDLPPCVLPSEPTKSSPSRPSKGKSPPSGAAAESGARTVARTAPRPSGVGAVDAGASPADVQKPPEVNAMMERILRKLAESGSPYADLHDPKQPVELAGMDASNIERLMKITELLENELTYWEGQQRLELERLTKLENENAAERRATEEEISRMRDEIAVITELEEECNKYDQELCAQHAQLTQDEVKAAGEVCWFEAQHKSASLDVAKYRKLVADRDEARHLLLEPLKTIGSGKATGRESPRGKAFQKGNDNAKEIVEKDRPPPLIKDSECDTFRDTVESALEYQLASTVHTVSGVRPAVLEFLKAFEDEERAGSVATRGSSRSSKLPSRLGSKASSGVASNHDAREAIIREARSSKHEGASPQAPKLSVAFQDASP